jgi:hypothetical protein
LYILCASRMYSCVHTETLLAERKSAKAKASSLKFPPSQARHQDLPRANVSWGLARLRLAAHEYKDGMPQRACKHPCTSMHNDLHSVYALRN